ncbi:MAG: hypothetical protein H5U00_07855 [Clostridia bacterium]|nr:hypothetical protein [Clostridia bacterium]
MSPQSQPATGKPQPQAKSLTAARLGWAVWFCVLVLSAFIVPFAFLGSIASIAASFLYWTVFALVAIVSIITMISRWRD